MAKEYYDGAPCPMCKGQLKSNSITETFTYKGKSFDYPNYVVHVCDKCGEEFVGDKTMKQSARKVRDFYRVVDGLLTASEIKRIRVKLGRSQEDLSSILGGGLKAFARYENSDVIQAESMDNLLRILDEMPHAIEIIERKHLPKRKILSVSQVYSLTQGKLVGTYDK
jgi:HTH-type transcriptional regulator / antitoxin MqsA